MDIYEHLELIKAEIEKLDPKPTVKLFSGTLNDADLKNLKIDGSRPYIMLGTAGGPMVDKSPRLEIDSVFGAFIVAKADPDTQGLSRVAMKSAVEVAQLLDKYRGDLSTTTGKPVIQSISELFSGVRNGTNYSAWQVIWTQRLVLI